ncbi:MAG: 5-(carboxyamino)imidazole ribonucleotide synthase [Oleispira sp.]|jgi:5-(carboxyamino)imidazole ribonucleotide synthase|tara:strand:+ start:4557 stop:5627 length:1071 start_codon:yes stop_codon:yes gene_type:complete
MKLGILGNGQLGQMLETSIADQSDITVNLYDLRAFDETSLQQFLNDNDRISYETENIPAHIVSQMESVEEKVFPSLKALKTFQNRITEKNALRAAGIDTAEFHAVNSLADIHDAVQKLGLPIIMKTTTEGYDGKGQFVLREPSDATAAWAEIGNRELIAEAFVPFIREVSVIGCRAENGDIKVWPMTENIHHEGILRYSLYPAHGFSAEKQAIAERYIEQIATSLDYVGTITLELFETEDNLIANEVAPRVHNSGHWSIEGAVTSQFRNHMLAVTGQAITDTASKFAAVAMINVISDEGPTAAGEDMSETYVHSYGKEARPARKLGHVTITAANTDERDSKISQLEGLIPTGVWTK